MYFENLIFCGIHKTCILSSIKALLIAYTNAEVEPSRYLSYVRICYFLRNLCMYTMKYYYIHSLIFSPTSFPQGPFSYFYPQPHFLLIFLNHSPLSPIRAPPMWMRVSHALEHGEWFPLPQQLPNANNSSGRCGFLLAPPSPMLEFWLAWSYPGLA